MSSKQLFDGLGAVGDRYYQEACDYTPRRRHWIWRGLAAACVCLGILGALLALPQEEHVFVVKTYALDLEEDGTIGLRAQDIWERPEILGGHFDGKNFYVNIGLGYEGDHVAQVTFSTETGFFASQNVAELSLEENVSRMYVGPEQQLAMCGEEFEIVGNRVTVDKSTLESGTLLFWGMEASGSDDLPEQVPITAEAEFRDGTKQTVSVTLDIAGPMVYSIEESPEEVQQRWEEWEKEREHYQNIPLESCELVEESVEHVTDQYEIQDPGGGPSWILDLDKLTESDFDEHGIYRSRFRGSLDGRVYLPIIRREVDGTFTGMLYRVPEELEYSGGYRGLEGDSPSRS